jgi:hypothetical protein
MNSLSNKLSNEHHCKVKKQEPQLVAGFYVIIIPISYDHSFKASTTNTQIVTRVCFANSGF